MDRTRIDVRTDSGHYPDRHRTGAAGRPRGSCSPKNTSRAARSSSAAPRCGACTARRSRARCRGPECILIPDGEKAKTLQTASRVYDALVTAQADRGAGIVAIGGGVIGDTAGFAAATYLRGIRVAHVPTTLLAQVDSAVGGKVGVNHALGKNLIGAFHQPQAGRHRPARAHDAAAARVPRGPLRGGEVRHGVRRGAVRAGAHEHAGDLRPQPRGAVTHHRRPAAASRPPSCRRTSGNADAAGC